MTTLFGGVVGKTVVVEGVPDVTGAVEVVVLTSITIGVEVILVTVTPPAVAVTPAEVDVIPIIPPEVGVVGGCTVVVGQGP